MKKTVLCILFALSLLLTSCEYVGSIPLVIRETEAETETEEVAYQSDDFIGIWYSEDTCAVLDISANEVQIYSLQPGYYAYTEKNSATYTQSPEEHTLTVSYGDGITLTRDSDTTLTDGTYSFTLTEDLPTEHPVVEFPDFTTVSDASLYITFQMPDFATKINENAETYRITALKELFETVPSKQTVGEGDTVLIDYTGYYTEADTESPSGYKKTDETFSGGSATDTELVAKDGNGYIDGFASGLVGHAVGETFDNVVTFPEDYSSTDLAGVTVIFEMTIHSVYDESALTDEAVSTKTEGKYADALSYLLSLAVEDSETLIQELWSASYEITTEMPTEYTEYFVQYFKDMYHYYAWYYSIDYDTFLSYVGMTEEGIVTAGKNNASYVLAGYEIARALGITVTKDYNTLYDNIITKIQETYYGTTPTEETEA